VADRGGEMGAGKRETHTVKVQMGAIKNSGKVIRKHCGMHMTMYTSSHEMIAIVNFRERGMYITI